ncbi:RHS Repeat protein [compost metagenome]
MNREKKYFSFSFFVMLIALLTITKLQAQLTLTGPTTAHYGDIVNYTLSEDSEFWDYSWGADGTVLTDQDGYQTAVEVYWDGNSGSNRLVYAFYKSRTYWNETYYEELSVNVLSDPSTPEVPSISSIDCNEVVLQRTNPPGNSRVNNEDITWYWQSTPTGTSTANSNPTITLNSGVEYFLRAKSNNGSNSWSSSSSSIHYQLKPSAPTIGSITQPTGGSSTGSVVLTGLPNDNWVINPGNIVGFGTTKTITGLSASTTYNFTVTNSSGCSSNASANVVINTQSVVIASPVIGAITHPSCAKTTGSFTITNYNASYIYTANPSTGVSFSGANVVAPSGNYTILASQGATTSTPSSPITINAVPNNCAISNENYIHTINPTVGVADIGSLSDSQKQESITYFDGIGRPMQSIGIHAGGNNEDIITHIGYDDFGRQEKEYLPYTENTNHGLFRTGNIDLATKNFYNTTKYENTTNPYSQKDLETSPLSRIVKQAAPGEDWKISSGHEIKFDYQTNTNQDQVRLFGVSFIDGNTESPSLEDRGIYAVPQLYKTIIKDENWMATQTDLNEHTTNEFKDKEGRVVLKRTYATVEAGTTIEKYDTYYVYDDFGNLTYVIPPKASDLIGGNTPNIRADSTSTAVVNSGSSLHITATNSIKLAVGFNSKAGSTFSAVIVNGNQNILNDLCYQYRYDSRNRLVEKKLPGKEWEYIIYDRLDRPILTQDANLRTDKKWLFTKYDALSRPVYTGEYVNNNETNRLAVQGLTNSALLFESKQAVVQTILGTSINYTNVAFPTTGINLFAINYYDDYLNVELYDGTAANAVSYGVTPITNPKGLNTCSKIRILETDSWITNVVYYDAKGMPIYHYNKNILLNIASTVKSQLDFTGKVLETTSTHQKGLNGIITTIDTFTYDNEGRLLTQKQKINSQTPEFIVSNIYDGLGQLISKGVGGKTDTPNRLQTVNFAYNIRGWLKGINDSDANNGTITMDAGALFGFQISYNKPSSGKALFNGNISQTFWKTANSDTSLKNYNYTYDGVNRLSEATDNLTKFNETVKYDKNGNITYLKRLGEVVTGSPVPLITNPGDFGVMDELTYTYDSGNRLMKVADAAPVDGFGFKDDAVNTAVDSQDDYSYDANGNMKTDANKGIIDIKYNHLNLPTKVTLSAGVIEYLYDASGVKQQKKANTITTDYAAGFIYENGILKFLSHPEGYVSNNTGTYDYIYQYKDHLGNIRLSYGDANNNGSVASDEIIEENNYYPFGLKQKGYNYATNLSKGNATAQKYKYNGKELQDDNIGGTQLNFYDYGARNYDPALGRWMNIDPLAEFDYSVTSYNYTLNNPILLNDPTGLSTHVKLNKNGEWEVVEGGDPNDKDDNIYIIAYDKNGKNATKTGLRIGKSLTSHSFFDDDNKAVAGAIIDLKSTEGQDFIDNEIIEDHPFILNYMSNASGGEDYDFKERGMEKAIKNGKSPLQNRYRGSVARNGKIGSARDFGNEAAGIVAGRFGLSWKAARLGFDALETKQHTSNIFVGIPGGGTIIIPNINFTSEKVPTQKAQKLGWEIGIKLNKEDDKIDFFKK